MSYLRPFDARINLDGTAHPSIYVEVAPGHSTPQQRLSLSCPQPRYTLACRSASHVLVLSSHHPHALNTTWRLGLPIPISLAAS